MRVKHVWDIYYQMHVHWSQGTVRVWDDWRLCKGLGLEQVKGLDGTKEEDEELPKASEG
jgi:hypothetical protein